MSDIFEQLLESDAPDSCTQEVEIGYIRELKNHIAELERQRDSALNYLREHYSSAYDPVRQIFGIELEVERSTDCRNKTRCEEIKYSLKNSKDGIIIVDQHDNKISNEELDILLDGIMGRSKPVCQTQAEPTCPTCNDKKYFICPECNSELKHGFRDGKHIAYCYNGCQNYRIEMPEQLNEDGSEIVNTCSDCQPVCQTCADTRLKLSHPKGVPFSQSLANMEECPDCQPVCPTCDGETRLFYDADSNQVDSQDIDRIVIVKKCPDCGKDGES